MSNASNNQGRAYEFICLLSLSDAINAIRPAQVIHNTSYDAAQRAWETLVLMSKHYIHLVQNLQSTQYLHLNQILSKVSDDVLNLYIQTDQHGEEADVRDIIIEEKGHHLGDRT